MLTEQRKKELLKIANDIADELAGSAQSWHFDHDERFSSLNKEEQVYAEDAIFQEVDCCTWCGWWIREDEFASSKDGELICTECEEQDDEEDE